MSRRPLTTVLGRDQVDQIGTVGLPLLHGPLVVGLGAAPGLEGVADEDDWAEEDEYEDVRPSGDGEHGHSGGDGGEGREPGEAPRLWGIGRTRELVLLALERCEHPGRGVVGDDRHRAGARHVRLALDGELRVADGDPLAGLDENRSVDAPPVDLGTVGGAEVDQLDGITDGDAHVGARGERIRQRDGVGRVAPDGVGTEPQREGAAGIRALVDGDGCGQRRAVGGVRIDRRQAQGVARSHVRGGHRVGPRHRPMVSARHRQGQPARRAGHTRREPVGDGANGGVGRAIEHQVGARAVAWLEAQEQLHECETISWPRWSPAPLPDGSRRLTCR